MLDKRNVFTFTCVTSILLLASGCDTKKKVDRVLDNANKLVVEYKRLGENLNKTIADLRKAAVTAVNQSPALAAKVPALPAKVTGGVNVATEQAGKSGKAPADIDGLEANEEVGVFVPDGADEASSPALVAWEGDAESDDEGVCYLAWQKGTTDWFVAASCGATDGGYVCEVDGESISCSACNAEGECNPCDLETEDFACTWPGASEPAASTADEEPPADGE